MEGGGGRWSKVKEDKKNMWNTVEEAEGKWKVVKKRWRKMEEGG